MRTLSLLEESRCFLKMNRDKLCIQAKSDLGYTTSNESDFELIQAPIADVKPIGLRANVTGYGFIAKGYFRRVNLTGEWADHSRKADVLTVDFLLGQDMAFLAMAVLIECTATDFCKKRRVFTVDTRPWFMARYAIYRLQQASHRAGETDSATAICQVFSASDSLIIQRLDHKTIGQCIWVAWCNSDDRLRVCLASNAQCHVECAAIIQEIAALPRAKLRSHWLVVFELRRIHAAPIHRIGPLVKGERLLTNGFFSTRQNEKGSACQVGVGVGVGERLSVFSKVPHALRRSASNEFFRTCLRSADSRSKRVRPHALFC